MFSPGAPLFRRGGHLFMVVAAIFVGLAGAIGAVAFRLLIRTVQAAAFDGAEGLAELAEQGLLAEASDPMDTVGDLPWYGRILVPTIGGLIVGPLIYFFAREARGHGVPEVMKAVALRGGVIRLRVVAVKALASALSIGSGGSVGREGPIVQIGSAFGSSLGQILKLNTAQIRTLVGCGAAAGIAATFNAPIAGALFASEIIIRGFAVSEFTPIVISAVVAVVVSRFFLGNTPAFEVPAYEIVSPFELLPYMGVGVAAGLVAVLFIRTLSYSEDLFEKVPVPEYLRAAIGGALVGVIAIQLPHVYGVGYTTISWALAGSLPLITMGLLVLAKILATSITIGSGGSGGIFAPSLFLGAMTGGFLGSIIHMYFPESTASSGAYALVTMGAVVAATTHAPISAILIIFELTQTIDIIPALMSACVVSTLVSQLLNRDSIYTAKLTRQGIDLYKEEDPNVLKSLFVRDVLDPEPEVVPASASFKSILDLVVQSRHSQFFVVDDQNELMGAIALSELRRLIYEQDALQLVVVAGDLVDRRRPTVSRDDHLDLLMHMFSGGEYDELAVVDASNRLVGSVIQKDVIEARNREMLRRDPTGGFATSVSVVSKGQTVDLGDGYVLRELLVPPHFAGQTLRQAALREDADVHVLLARGRTASGGTKPLRVPGPNHLLENGDSLVVAGSRESVEKFAGLR
ncbi:MAG: chloride channel protein [Myxococcota bacterium]